MESFRILGAVFFWVVFALSARADLPAQHTLPPGSGSGRPPDAASLRCELVDQHGQPRLSEGRLSPFWSQEYIGMPYIPGALDRIRSEQGPLHPIHYGVMDGGFNPGELSGAISPRLRAIFARTEVTGGGGFHGTSAANLLNGSAPSGYGFGQLHALTVDDTNLAASVGAMLNTGVDVVSCSLWQFRNEPIPQLDRLARQAIVVFSAGNWYASRATPDFSGQPDAGSIAMMLANSGSNPLAAAAPLLASSPNVISAGSMSPYGWPSNFSQEGSGVDISVPSDWMQRVRNGSAYHSFGGTSGAAPLVAGIAGIAKGILGDLTTDEMRILLSRTAVPTSFTARGQRANGAGMLNAYKIVEVAARLRRRGWPANRATLLQDPAVYDFSRTGPMEPEVNAGTLLTQGKSLLSRADCRSQQAGLGMVHRAFLLTAGVPGAENARIYSEARHVMAAELDRAGLTINAAFFHSLDPREIEPVIAERLAHQTDAERTTYVTDPLLRAVQTLTPDRAHHLLAEAMASPHLRAVGNAIHVALQQIPPDGALFQEAIHHPDLAARRAIVLGAAQAATIGGGTWPVLQAAVQDGEPSIRLAAVEGVSSKAYGTPEVNAFFNWVLRNSHDPAVLASARAGLGLQVESGHPPQAHVADPRDEVRRAADEAKKAAEEAGR